MKQARNNAPADVPRPVEHIEVNEDKLPVRLILVVALLSLGLVLIVQGVRRLLNANPGWQQVEISAKETNCAGDFVLWYDLGRDGASSTAERRALNQVYSDAVVQGYRIFHPHERFAGLGNLASLSDSFNQSVSVEPELYSALEKVVASGSRLIYLSPVYEMYYSLFFSQSPIDAAGYDPWQDAELAAWCAQCASYAGDSESVNLELLGENRVLLRVSEEYAAFLKENGVRDLLDFFWMENAFLTDFLTERLLSAGLDHGCLVSKNGFVRCFAPGESPFTEAIYHRDGTLTRLSGALTLSGGMAVASLRSYPVTEADGLWYSVMEDGSIRTPFPDIRDGLCRTALPELTGVSNTLSCGELALLLSEVFIGDTPDPNALAALPGHGAEVIWFEGNSLRCSDESLKIAVY